MHYILLLHCDLNVMQSDKIKCMLEETNERCGDDIKKTLLLCRLNVLLDNILQLLIYCGCRISSRLVLNEATRWIVLS
jgi:hypothetical protein